VFKAYNKLRQYADTNIIFAILTVCVIVLLVWMNIAVERQKLKIIEDSLNGYMGYLKNMIFSSTYDSLKKGNMKLFTNMLEEIGRYEYVHEFSLVTPDGTIKYSSNKEMANGIDNNVLGLSDKLQLNNKEESIFYFPVTTVNYCTRCHTGWGVGDINSFYKVSLSRRALNDISNFSINTYLMVIFSGSIVIIFIYMAFYMIKKKISEEHVKESEAKFRSLFENIMDVQFRTDIYGNLTLISPSGVRLLGYESEDEMIRYGLGQSMFYDVKERTEYLRTLASEGEVKNYEITLRKKDMTPVIVEMNTKIIYDNIKNPVAIEGIFRDITYRKEYEKQLNLMGIVFDTAIESIMITNSRGVINNVNPAFTEITGYRAKEVIGKTPKILKSERQPEHFYIGMQKKLFREGRWTGEIWNKKANGEIYPEWLSIINIKDAKGRITHYVYMGHDITELKRSEEQLKHQAYHDPLTGLPNRELMVDRLEMALAYASRHDKKLAVLFVDLDNFKQVNDTAGHHVGDIFLQKISSLLQDCCREEDTVARMGGDEFVILLPDADDNHSAVNVCRRVIETFSTPMEIRGYKLVPSASIGIAVYPKDGITCTDLLRAADMAMYYAKQQGKGDYIFYNTFMDTSDSIRLGIEADLYNAVKNNEFILNYQPVVSLKDNRIKGFEVLIRWRKPDGTLVLPGEFIDIAEQSSLILSIGHFVIEEACRILQKVHSEGFSNISFSINISSRQFQSKGLSEKISDAIEKYNIPKNRLILEITENTVISDVKTAIETMKVLSSSGVRLSLDDFGTGYSSLAYLKEFPINILKIDKTFTRDLMTNVEEQHITDAIVALGKNFKMLVIAEGVENEYQIEYLKKLNCDFIQGFYFSKPVSEEAMMALLKSGKMLDI